jgi:hypothetical protein
MSDPIEDLDRLNAEIRMITMPANQVVQRWQVIALAGILGAANILALLGVGYIAWLNQRQLATQVTPLQERNSDLAAQVADAEIVEDQCVYWITVITATLAENNLPVPRVILDPDEPVPGD